MTELSPHIQSNPISIFVPLTIGGSAAVIHLTREKIALVDLADWKRVSEYKWHTMGPMKSGQFYASSGDHIYLHRFVIRPSPEQLVDHRENNGLNCRRSNIRVCTVAQNQANRHVRLRASGIKGVHWHKAAKKWCAQIRVKTKRIYLGLFNSEQAAAQAYDDAARKNWGEFANTNSPPLASVGNGTGGF